METIALIASLICGLTALTTSLRARGRSREASRSQILSSLSSSGRAAGHHSTRSSHRISLYFIVTLIWHVLAILFALPVVAGALSEGDTSKWFLVIVMLLLITLGITIIWISIIHSGKNQ